MASEVGGMPARYVSPRTVALYGILTALTASITYASYTPFSPTKGYFNLGDSMVFFSAFAFSWRAGMICGGVGSAAADILLGSGIYAPITLVAKGAEGFVAGVIGRRRPGKGWVIVLTALIVSIAAIGSILIDWPSSAYGVDRWILQLILPVTAIVVFCVLFFRFRQAIIQWTPVLIGIGIGGSCMIVTYFVGEYVLLDVGLGKALAEVPINIGQVVLGGTIGTLLSYYVTRSYPALARRA